MEAMKARRPGPKVDAVKAENARLRAKVAELEGQLATAEELIDAQGKASALLQAMRQPAGVRTSSSSLGPHPARVELR